MLSTRERGVLGALLISLAVAACGGGTASTAPSATTTPGATAVATPPPAASQAASAAAPTSGVIGTSGRIEVPGKGFAVTLPDGWNRVDLSSSDIESLMAAAGELDPALAAQYSAQIQSMVAAGLAVFAFGPDPASGTNLTILALPGGGLSLDLLEQINTTQVEALAEGGVESERVTLPAGEAIHYAYQIDAGNGTSPTIDQYLMLVGDNQLVVTVTGGEAGDAEAIANSVESLD